MKLKLKIIYKLLLVLAAVIVLNTFSAYIFYRADFTADKRYTLDRATKRILKDVEENIIITLFVSEDLPPNISRTIDDLKKMLIEYSNYSSYRIEFEEINPNENEDFEMEAIRAGIHPIPLEIRQKDQLKVQKVYLGLTLQLGDKIEVLPLIRPGMAMEYSLSTLIKKLSVKKRLEVGYLQGHGEPSLAAIQQAYNELSVLYDIKPISLFTEPNLERFASIIIIGSSGTFTRTELNNLDAYLSKSGSLFIGLDRVHGMLSEGIGIANNTGLERWLASKGLYVEESFVVDQKCSNVTVHQQQGFFAYDQQVAFPFLPIISNFSKHAITDGIESVIFQFVSPITYVGDTTHKFTPLAWSSNISGKLRSPLSFNVNKKWSSKDFLYPKLILAGLLEGKLVGDKTSRICLIADGNFMVNGMGTSKINIQEDNINLMANAVDWLSDDSGLLSLRTKSILSRPLDELSESTTYFIKLFNFLFPILLIICFGLIRFERKRRLRIRRMKQGVLK